MRLERALLASLLSTVLLAGGCTLWFALNQDPSGLPCDPDGKCLEGYTCLDGECLLAAAIELGQPCQGDAECVVQGFTSSLTRRPVA